jgi:hypothetical protein
VKAGWLLAPAYVALALAIFACRPAATSGPLTRDFEAYWSAGAAWNAHADPYGRRIWEAERTIPGVDARRDELLPFIGPPATLPLWGRLAAIPYGPAATLWLAVLVAALLALVLAVIRGADMRISALAFFAASALGIAFGPITSDLALGQLALPAFLGATLLVVSAESSLPAAVTAALLAFAQPNVALGLCSGLGRNRTTLAIAGGALIAYAVGALAAGWGWPLEYAAAAAAHGAAERFVAIQFTPAAIAYGFGATPRAAGLATLGLLALAVAAALALSRRVRDRFARFAGWSALVPFAAPFFHEHDFVVAYGAALWCALRARGSQRALALAGTLLVSIDWLGLAQRPTGLLQSGLLAATAGCAFAALGEPRDARGAVLVSLGVAALFAGACALALAHPAPVWPASLGAFHAQAGAGAAAVWLAEQRASGLLALVPAWAALRTLPLVGCALLAGAIYQRPSSDRTA